MQQEDIYGVQSPGGFVFGIQGWSWGEPKPSSITFFLDNTARVSDQYGRPIKGAFIDSKEVRFASAPPGETVNKEERGKLATHLQTVAALTSERFDWKTVTYAGWPQLPYAMLKDVKNLPLTPIEELRKIRDPQLRKDALKMRREMEEALVKDESIGEE